jgi:hypothetical protein
MVDVFIIGIKGRLRSKSLGEWSDSGKSAQTITFVDPVSYSRGQVPRLLDMYTGLHYGNRLTDGEWGCSLAHLNAQTQALSKSSEWVLILEDDARVSDNFAEELRILVSLLPLGQDHPLGVNCFGSKSAPRPLGNQVNLEFLHRSPPLGAVGYLLNQSALELATRSQYRDHPVGKADFPAWAHQVTWARARPAIVFHEEDQISFVGPRQLASRHRGILFKLVHAATRVLLFLLPVVNIRNRLSWEFDFILNRNAEVRSQTSEIDRN